MLMVGHLLQRNSHFKMQNYGIDVKLRCNEHKSSFFCFWCFPLFFFCLILREMVSIKILVGEKPVIYIYFFFLPAEITVQRYCVVFTNIQFIFHKGAVLQQTTGLGHIDHFRTNPFLLSTPYWSCKPQGLSSSALPFMLPIYKWKL